MEEKLAIHDFLTTDEQKLLIDLIPDTLMLVTPADGRIVYSNRAPAGMTVGQLIGRNYLSLGCEKSRPQMAEALAAASERLQIRELEVEIRLDGESRWTLIRLLPVVRDGIPHYLLVTHIDIAPLKNLIGELKQSRQRLSDHLEQTPLAAMMWDAQQTTVEWNPAAELMFGYSRQEAIGRPFTELIVPRAEWENRRRQFASAIASGEIDKYPPYPNCTKDGRIIICEWFSTTIRNAAGDVVGIASLAQDVTAKLQAEKELQLAKLEAEASARAKANFLANMSHEIRTPMNGIMGMIELLGDDGLTPSQQAKLEIIQQSTHTLLNILNDILDFSKIEADAMVIEHIPVDINYLLRQVVELMRPATEKKQLQLSWQPLDDACSQVLGDPNRITQILGNLISNAVKFTEHGSICIETCAIPQGDGRLMLEVAVTDTGIGIAAHDLERIFDDFSQADASITRRYGGTGLGLTICQRLAQLMGGEIRASSEPGKGSCFVFAWPAEPAQRQPAHKDVPAPPTLQQYRHTVLLVDDNEVNLKVGAKMLEKLGLAVHCARNGQQALQQLQQGPVVDLVLMDIHMPEMNGVEATRAIRGLGGRLAELPVVAVTANVLDEEKQHCLRAGMDGFLGKPFSLAELNRTLARWLA